MTRKIKVLIDDNFESCDDCIHSDDTEEICKMRGCIHAILDDDIKDCYQPKESERKDDKNRYMGRNRNTKSNSY